MSTRGNRKSGFARVVLAAALLSAPLFVGTAQALPICNNGTDCRSMLIGDAEDLIAALQAGVLAGYSERDARSPIQDLQEAVRRFQEAPKKELITYCAGAAKEDDRAMKKLARAAKAIEKLLGKSLAPPSLFPLTQEMVGDLMATVTQAADEVQAVLGSVTSQIESCRSRLTKAQGYFTANKFGKAADSAQRGYDTIRDPGCEVSMRSCTASFSPDLIDSDVDTDTDFEFTPSPEAPSCKVEVLVNGVSLGGGLVTPCETFSVTLTYDSFVTDYGLSVGDTFTFKYLRSNDTPACQASVALVAP